MRLRPLVVLAAVVCAAASLARAEDAPSVEIAPFIGYRAGGSVTDVSGMSQALDGSQSAGLTVTVPIGRLDRVEFLYSHQGSSVEVDSSEGTARYPLSFDYWMLGTAREFPGESERVRPFLAGYGGVAVVGASHGSVNNGTAFSVGLGGGVKLDLGRTVAVRFDARALFIFLGSGGGIYCSGGCVATFSGSGMLQGEATASLVLKL